MSRADRLVADGFLPAKEAAKFLGISRSSLYELLKAQVITHAKIRGRKAVPIAALREYAKSRLQLGSVA